MSELPSGWISKRLGDLAQVTMGQSPPGSSYNKHAVGMPFFQGKAEFGEKHPTVRQWTTAGTKFAQPGDILMSVRAPVGPTNIADTQCAIGRGLAGIRAGASLDQSYLIWYLKYVEASIQARGKGTTFDAISGNDLRDTVVNLPPLDEQRRIVETLDDYLSRLDKALAEVDLLNDRFKLLMQATTEKVIAVDFPRVRLEEVMLSAGYGTSEKCVVGGTGVAVARIPNLVNGTVDMTDEKRVQNGAANLSNLILSKGDFLVIRTNGSQSLVGTTAVVQESIGASFASYLIRFKFDNRKVNPNWVHEMFGSLAVRQQIDELSASSAGQYNLGLSKLNRIEIPLPDLTQQAELVRELQRIRSVTDSLKRNQAAVATRIDTLRRAILHKAFIGGLAVA